MKYNPTTITKHSGVNSLMLNTFFEINLLLAISCDEKKLKQLFKSNHMHDYCSFVLIKPLN